MAKKSPKSKVTSQAALQGSIGAFWGNQKADKSDAFKFYMSYLSYKHAQSDWMAMKLAKENRAWILSFYNKKMKKSTSTDASSFTKKPRPKGSGRKLEKININKVTSAEELEYPPDKVTVFVDAGTKNNGKVGLQRTRIACVDAHQELVFDIEIGDCTNNQGEIRAIVEILRQAKANGWSCNIYSDSQIAIGWTTRGVTKASYENDKYATEAKRLIEETRSVISWTPRDINLAGIYLEENYQI
jgi:ribonuclease HI